MCIRDSYRFLETEDEYWDSAASHQRQGFWMIYSVFLPKDVLEKIYRTNAQKVLYGLPKTFLEDFRTRIESLTAAQIEAASARHLDTYRQAIAIVGDWQKVKDQVTPFGTVTVYTPEGEIKKGLD